METIRGSSRSAPFSTRSGPRRTWAAASSRKTCSAPAGMSLDGRAHVLVLGQRRWQLGACVGKRPAPWQRLLRAHAAASTCRAPNLSRWSTGSNSGGTFTVGAVILGSIRGFQFPRSSPPLPSRPNTRITNTTDERMTLQEFGYASNKHLLLGRRALQGIRQPTGVEREYKESRAWRSRVEWCYLGNREDTVRRAYLLGEVLHAHVGRRRQSPQPCRLWTQ